MAVVIGFSRLKTQLEEQRTRADQALEELAESGDNTASAREVVAASEYASTIRNAQREYDSGNLRAMLALLDSTEPKRRGWEWNHLHRLADRSLLTLEGHLGSVLSVAFSPDGTRILTGSHDFTAKVWDASSGKEVFHLTDHRDIVRSVGYSPNGSRIVTGGGPDGPVKIWDAGTGRAVDALRVYREHDTASISFNREGSRAITGIADKTAKLWNRVKVGDEHVVESVVLRGHEGLVVSAAFGPEDSRIVTASQDGTAKVWDANTGKELFTLRGHPPGVLAVVFNRDGTRIATGGLDGTAKVWDANTGAQLLTLRGHTGAVQGVSFRNDGVRIVTAGQDGTARVWDATTGRELNTIKGHHGLAIHAAAFSPDGKRIVTAGVDRTAKVWDAEPADEFVTLMKPDGRRSFVSRAFNPDWTRVATVDDSEQVVVVSDRKSGAELFRLTGHTKRIGCIVFSPNGTRILTGSDDRTARIWDAKTGAELRKIQEVPNSVVVFRPDGKAILSGGGILWDTETGAVIRRFESYTTKHGTCSFGSISENPFSPDGTQIVSTDGRAGVWDVRTGEKLLSLTEPKNANGFSVSSASFSPDGTRVLGACRTGWNQGRGAVWDVRPDGELSRTAKARYGGNGWWSDGFHRLELFALRGHTDYVYWATFSPDGTRILTGGDDKTAKLWDAKTGVELFTLRGVRLRSGGVFSVWTVRGSGP